MGIFIWAHSYSESRLHFPSFPLMEKCSGDKVLTNGICLKFHVVDSKHHSWEVLASPYVSCAPATIPFLPSCCLEHGCYIMDHENEGHTQTMVEWESERSNIRCRLTSPELLALEFTWQMNFCISLLLQVWPTTPTSIIRVLTDCQNCRSSAPPRLTESESAV